MARTKAEFNDICDAFEQALPDSYVSEDDVEDYHRRFVDEDASRTISLLWLANASDNWFEVDGYENGEITGSDTVSYDTVNQSGDYDFSAITVTDLFN